MAWSPDGSCLAVAGSGTPLLLWEPATGVTTTVGDVGDSATGVVWAPDSRHVLTTSEDGAVVLHPVDGTATTRLQVAGANCVDWAGPTIAVGTRTGPVVLELRV